MIYNDTAYYIKSLYTFQIVKEAFEQGLFSKEDYDEFLRKLISLESVEGGADMRSE